MKEIGLYVHIPFCKQKCLYCDFHSFSGNTELYKQYVAILQKELQYKAILYQTYAIKTIFFGGGTPTVLNVEYLAMLLQTIFDCYNVKKEAEITIEANPGTLDIKTCTALKAMGFNRMSMGVQAWQDELLQRLGRIHTKAQFLENYQNARNAGFDNINIDLMFCLPNQTIKQWEETLTNMIHLKPEHISTYSLIVEEGTPFFDLYEEGIYHYTEEEIDRDMFNLAKQILTGAGYIQYEISNFAKEGKQCQHNKIYWRDEAYIGCGLGAHSFIDTKRFHNPYELKIYIQKSPEHYPEDIEYLTLKDQYAEFMFMGLRMTEGIEKKRFFNRFGKQIEEIYGAEIEQLKQKKLLIEENGYIRLTHFGVDVSNQVFLYFL